MANVSIRPGPGILSVLRHLNYKPWFALAEFVDNAVQSAATHRNELLAAHGADWHLVVRINVEAGSPARISIRDNAAGISLKDFGRAFRPAAVPPDATGLSEFGMGMKSAACWFSPKWQVRTRALNDPVVRTVKFDVERIVTDALEELEIVEDTAPSSRTFTEIVLDDLHNVPVGRTLGKVKEHLADIYRVFTRDGTLELWVNEERLSYETPGILLAPYVRDSEGAARLWRKEIDFPLGGGLAVTGFAALRDPGSHTRSGFALFRRGRLIEGSGEEGYRPTLIFGAPGSFRHLRLFGELHLEGFEVSHTKDGFRWDDNELPFLELLREELDKDELPLLRQADGYRALESKRDRARAAAQALDRAGDAIEQHMGEVLPRVAEAPPAETETEPLTPQSLLAKRELRFEFRGVPWIVRIELSDDASESQWLALSDQAPTAETPSIVELRLGMSHPFMVSFAQTNTQDVEVMIRIAGALALAEVLARRAGIKYAGTIRRNLNDILREALSQPSI